MVMGGALLPWLAWLLVSLAGIYLLGHFMHERRRRGLPPGPNPLPIIGSLHLLGNQPHRSLARLAKVHGPLMSLRLGSVTTVVASSSAVAQEILQRHDAVFSNRSVPDAPGAHAKNSSVWLPNASRWRALRKIMGTELFAPQRLDALQHLRRDKVQELVEHVARLARKGEAASVGRVAFTTSLNLVARTIFSRDLTSLDDDGGSREFQEVVMDIMEAVGSPNVSDFGCGHNNAGTFGEVDRLLGLGRGKASLSSQVASRYGAGFSYCLPSSANAVGYLSFGEAATRAPANAKFRETCLGGGEPGGGGVGGRRRHWMQRKKMNGGGRGGILGRPARPKA